MHYKQVTQLPTQEEKDFIKKLIYESYVAKADNQFVNDVIQALNIKPATGEYIDELLNIPVIESSLYDK